MRLRRDMESVVFRVVRPVCETTATLPMSDDDRVPAAYWLKSGVWSTAVSWEWGNPTQKLWKEP